MPNTLITTPDGERIRIMGDETVAHLLSVDHLENSLRKLSEREMMPGAEAGGINALAGWLAQVREEDRRADALDQQAERDARALQHDYEEDAA